MLLNTLLLAGFISCYPNPQDEWVPPEDINTNTLIQVMRSTPKDRLNGAYSTALAKHLWYHEASRSVPAMGGVRVSFAMSDWVRLAEVYEPAREAMREVRDKAIQVAKGDEPGSPFLAFQEVVTFNQNLDEAPKSLELFAWLHKNKPATAKQVFRLVSSELIAAKSFDLCGDYVDANVDRIVQMHGMLKRGAPQVANKMLAQQACEIAVILVNTDQVDESKKFRSSLLEKLNEDDRAVLALDLDRAATGVMPTVFVAETEQQQKLFENEIDTELDRLSAYIELDAGSRKQLKQELKSTVVSTALCYASTTLGDRLDGIAPSAFYIGVEAAVKKVMEQDARLDSYLADLRGRRRFAEQLIADDFLATLDRELWLTDEQYTACAKQVDRLAAESALPLPNRAARDPQSLLARGFESLLSKEQIELWRRYVARNRSFGPKSQESRRSEVKDDLRAIAARRINWLKEELKLSPKQVRRLQLVAKSTFGKPPKNEPTHASDWTHEPRDNRSKTV